MLTGTEIEFQKNLANIISSVITSEAFKQALLSTLPPSSRGDESAITMADNFGKIAAAYLSALSPLLATAIDNRIKQASLVITPTKLLCGVGPVSGAISPEEVQIL